MGRPHSHLRRSPRRSKEGQPLFALSGIGSGRGGAVSHDSTAQPQMDLRTLQREMAAAVMHPLTRDEGMRSHAADGRPMTEIASSFIAPNSRLNAFERLEIYNRQYWFRILGALAEDFAAVRAVVGTQRF